MDEKRILKIIVIFIILSFPIKVMAQDRLNPEQIPDLLSSDIQYLLDFTDTGEKSIFNPDLTKNIIEFFISPKKNKTLYHADKTIDASSAYHEFDIKTDLSKILQFAYSPDMPAYIDSLSSIRLTYWKEVNGKNQPLPKLWNHIPTLEQPVVIRGIEHQEITPDLFTGAYYQYDTKRTLILYKYNGRNVFISLTKQKGISTVGKKGIVLGPDENWNYCYTGQEGLALFGLGFLDTYMYDSFNITIFYENEPGLPGVRCGVLKWLRAGCKDMNLVRKHHIYRGLKRYSETFSNIIEHPSLPGFSELSTQFASIRALPLDELREKTKKYYKELKKKYGHEKIHAGMQFSEFMNENEFVNKMRKIEMQAVLNLEYMKNILGKYN